MKRRICYALAIAVILSFTLFTGCGAVSRTPDEVLTAMAADFETMADNLKNETEKTIESYGNSYENNNEALKTLYDDINKNVQILYTNTYNNTYVYLEAVLKTIDTSTEEGKDAYEDAVDAFYDEIYDDMWDFEDDINNCIYDACDEADQIITDDFWDDMMDAYFDDKYDITKILAERDLSTTVAITSTVQKKEDSEDKGKKSGKNTGNSGNGAKKPKEQTLTEDMVVGTWKVKNILLEGSEYTVKELEKVGEDVDEFKDMAMVVKTGGSAYLYSEGEGDTAEWTISAGKVHIGSEGLKYEDGCLILEMYDYPDINTKRWFHIDNIFAKEYINNQEIRSERKRKWHIANS